VLNKLFLKKNILFSVNDLLSCQEQTTHCVITWSVIYCFVFIRWLTSVKKSQIK